MGLSAASAGRKAHLAKGRRLLYSASAEAASVAESRSFAAGVAARRCASRAFRFFAGHVPAQLLIWLPPCRLAPGSRPPGGNLGTAKRRLVRAARGRAAGVATGRLFLRSSLWRTQGAQVRRGRRTQIGGGPAERRRREGRGLYQCRGA